MDLHLPQHEPPVGHAGIRLPTPPGAAQHRVLQRKLQGHDAYYGLTGNFPALERYRYEVRRIWRKWLDRRSNRARMGWDRFRLVLERYPLPPARVVQSVYRLAASP
jgi:RNA-directed DNA polymerase